METIVFNVHINNLGETEPFPEMVVRPELSPEKSDLEGSGWEHGIDSLSGTQIPLCWAVSFGRTVESETTCENLFNSNSLTKKRKVSKKKRSTTSTFPALKLIKIK